jgi:hypothetical protein
MEAALSLFADYLAALALTVVVLSAAVLCLFLADLRSRRK